MPYVKILQHWRLSSTKSRENRLSYGTVLLGTALVGMQCMAQGYPGTWRMVLENTDVSSPYVYEFVHRRVCQVPEGRLSDAQGAE